MNHSFEQIRQKIQKANTIVIFGHTNPDGDAIGACLGLGNSLAAVGKQVNVVLEEYADKYHLIPGAHLVTQKPAITPELVIALDCGDLLRLGEGGEFFSSYPSISIDHHKSNTYFGALNYVDSEASSTSEIVYRMINGFFPVDKKVATALYAGVLYDTGGFKHSCTSPVTMAVASELLTYEVPFTEIYEKFFFSNSFQAAKLLGRALEKAQLLWNGKIIFSTISTEDLQEFDADTKQLDSIVGYLKSVQDTLGAVFLYQKGEKEIKASFRSEQGLDVCQIAELFGGGGHVKASGCTLYLTMEEAEQKVLDAVKERI